VLDQNYFDDPNVDPANGLPLKHALAYFAAEPDFTDFNGKSVRSQFASLRLRSTFYHRDHALSLTHHDHRILAGLQRLYSEILVQRLRSGLLLARGFVPRRLAPADVPAEFWTGVRLDIEGNFAEANGMRITGILVFEQVVPGQSAGTEHAPQDEPKPKYSREALSAWFVLRERTWREGFPLPNIGQDRAAAEKEFDGLPGRDEFRRIRIKATSKNWRKQGPRVNR